MQLYYGLGSAPCRTVLLFLQALDLKPDMIMVDFEKGDHLTPEFLKMNPQHTIPVLNDDGFALSESRAIIAYLAEKYAPETTYYPSEPMSRAVVNQRLMFDLGTLYQRFFDTYLAPLLAGKTEINTVQYDKMHDALGFLEVFLGDAPYMAGDKITVADFTIIASISSIEAVGNDLSKYPKIHAWFMRCKGEIKDYEEINGKGATILADIIKMGVSL